MDLLITEKPHISNILLDAIENKNIEKFHQNLCKMEAPCFSYGEEIL